jgi:branched-chain amino acid transport system substrate-binding protein
LRRRSVLKHAGAGITAVTLAGCQEEPNPGGNGNGQRTVTGDGPWSGETIHLGLLPPERESSLGKPMINCMDLAVREINANGGIRGATVDYTVGPTNLSVSKARTEYAKMNQQIGVDATFGILLQLRSMIQTIGDAETIHISTANPDPFISRLVSRTTSPIGGNPKQEYEKYKYHFRYAPPNIDQAFGALNEVFNLYGDALGWDSAAVYLADLSMLEGVPQRMQKEASKYIDIPVAELVPDSLDDFSPLFDKAEDAGVDVVIVALALSASTAITQWANQERDFGLGGVLLGAGNSNFWEQSNGLCEGLFTAEAVVPGVKLTKYTKPFIDTYRSEFGNVPGAFGPIVYDAVRLYADAVRQAESRDPEDLIPYMEDMVWKRSIMMQEFEFHGPDHEYAHDPVLPCISPQTCDNPSGIPLIAQWQAAENGGVQEVVAPDQHQTAEYQDPPWMR